MNTIAQPTVFVVQENPNLNYNPAEKFGEIKFLTYDEFRPSRSSLRNIDLVSDITKAMAAFDPDKDYILLSGNPIMMGYVAHLALSKAGYAKFLWYSRNDQDYIEVAFCPALLLSQAAQ